MNHNIINIGTHRIVIETLIKFKSILILILKKTIIIYP